jgi:hypothetical protein
VPVRLSNSIKDSSRFGHSERTANAYGRASPPVSSAGRLVKAFFTTAGLNEP